MTSVEVDHGVMVDRALAQTAKAGLTYAVVPFPWLFEDWFHITRTGANVFEWYRYCGMKGEGWNCDKFPQRDGDVFICLVERPIANDMHADHDGPCGYEGVLHRHTGPAAEGFESVETLNHSSG